MKHTTRGRLLRPVLHLPALTKVQSNIGGFYPLLKPATFGKSRGPLTLKYYEAHLAGRSASVSFFAPLQAVALAALLVWAAEHLDHYCSGRCCCCCCYPVLIQISPTLN